MSSMCLIIQVFVKLDTLKGLLDSLLTCRGIGNLNVLIWQDGYIGSRKEDEYAQKSREVRLFIENESIKYSSSFASLDFVSNDENLGTCATCRAAVDYASGRFEKLIFTEDDSIFATDAIEWFDAALSLPEFQSPQVWAVSGESIFFDARGNALPPGYSSLARDFVMEERLVNAFQKLKFVPSTCFATTSEKWKEFSVTRGQPLGDVDVCKRCEKEDKYCIFPIVPRVKDIGMLHPDGYSVLIHTAANVKSIKSTYLMSSDIPCPDGFGPFSLLPEHKNGELWRRTVLLEGFGELPPWDSASRT